MDHHDCGRPNLPFVYVVVHIIRRTAVFILGMIYGTRYKVYTYITVGTRIVRNYSEYRHPERVEELTIDLLIA